MTSGAKADGRFGKQDFVYLPEEDAYRCPAGEKLTYRYTREEADKMLRRYWTTVCPDCPLKSQCTPAPQRRISRWEHEHVLEAVQQRLDQNSQAMRQRRETAEHPFATLKMRMRDGATRARLQSLAGDESYRCSTAIGCDKGIALSRRAPNRNQQGLS
jgi:macrodomain Ter protein organizer (MatP/YcbG family)